MPCQHQTSSVILLAIVSSRLPFSLSYFCSPSVSLCPWTLVGGTPVLLSQKVLKLLLQVDTTPLQRLDWHASRWKDLQLHHSNRKFSYISRPEYGGPPGLHNQGRPSDFFPPRKTKSPRWPRVFTFRNEKVDFISALREALLHTLIEHCGKWGDGWLGDSQIHTLGSQSQLHFLWSSLTHTVLLAPFPGVFLVISSFRAGLETWPPK